MHVKTFALTGFLSIVLLASGAATAPAHDNPASAHATATLPYGLLMAANDAFTRRPLAMDSLVWNEQKATANDGAGNDLFGLDIAIDGNVALVGVYHAVIGGNDEQGAVYVFTKSGGTWSQTQKLTASDGAAFDGFGSSVAIDGGVALIGSPGANPNGHENQGAVYVFTEYGGTWSQTQKLTSDDGAPSDFFGITVAVSGSTALVGANGTMIGDNIQQGAAYVFAASGGSWSQQQKLTASDGAPNDRFASSVALDDTTAVIAASDASVYGNVAQGKVYVFDEAGGTWGETQILIASDGAAGDQFGHATALDGNTVLVGSPFAKIGSNYGQGAVYAFAESGGTWYPLQKLVADDGAMDDYFGYAVALDGATAVIGAYHATVGGNPAQGAAYMFDESGGTWSQTRKLAASDGAVFDEFGTSVALSGTTALVDAPFANVGGVTNQGAAYFYDASCPQGYGEHDGALNAGSLYATASYQAPAGLESAILGAPGGFGLYVQYSDGGAPHALRIPGNEIHQYGPAGTYRWGVKAGDTGGNYVFCLLHP